MNVTFDLNADVGRMAYVHDALKLRMCRLLCARALAN